MAALLCCYRCSATTRENPTRRTSVASTRPDSASMTLAGLSFMLLVTMVPAGRSAGCAGGAADTIRGAALMAAARLTPNGSAGPREWATGIVAFAVRLCLTERASARD